MIQDGYLPLYSTSKDHNSRMMQHNDFCPFDILFTPEGSNGESGIEAFHILSQIFGNIRSACAPTNNESTEMHTNSKQQCSQPQGILIYGILYTGSNFSIKVLVPFPPK
jgi:hypothetical protein